MERKTVKVDSETHRKVKIFAAINGKDVHDIFIEGARLYMKTFRSKAKTDLSEMK